MRQQLSVAWGNTVSDRSRKVYRLDELLRIVGRPASRVLPASRVWEADDRQSPGFAGVPEIT
jgi:hypothetical protein